jgi:hypothetical protein
MWGGRADLFELRTTLGSDEREPLLLGCEGLARPRQPLVCISDLLLQQPDTTKPSASGDDSMLIIILVRHASISDEVGQVPVPSRRRDDSL